jgi:hypothetical protein
MALIAHPERNGGGRPHYCAVSRWATHGGRVAAGRGTCPPRRRARAAHPRARTSSRCTFTRWSSIEMLIGSTARRSISQHPQRGASVLKRAITAEDPRQSVAPVVWARTARPGDHRAEAEVDEEALACCRARRRRRRWAVPRS